MTTTGPPTPTTVAPVQDTRPEVTALIVSWVKDRRRAGESYEAIAKVLGVTKTAIQHLESEERGVGARIETAYATKFYGGSIDALRVAAREAAVGRARASTIPPNLGEALDFHRSRRRPVETVLDKLLQVASRTGDLQVSTWIAVVSDMLEVAKDASKKT